MNPVRRRPGMRSLRKRVAALELEVQESRRLNQRLSDVVDVVTEVLVPAADRDDERMRAALDRLDRTLKQNAPRLDDGDDDTVDTDEDDGV
jgi:hypothetical protein